MVNPIRKLTRIFKKGKNYYCLYCLNEGRLQRVSEYVGGLYSGAFYCYRHHRILSNEKVVEYPVEVEFYCPQCAMGGKLRRLKGARLLNGKMYGYFCPKHGMVPNPVSKTQAESIRNSAINYEIETRKENIFSYIKSISEGRLAESMLFFLSFLLIGALTTRVPNSPSIWIFVLYGLAALSINLFMRVDD